jgi:pimeloyl-ACP methyl ester carboxylesterase
MVLITERPADHALAILRGRVRQHLNPFFSFSRASESLTALDSVVRPASDEWAAAFMALGQAHAEQAGQFALDDRDAAAVAAWQLAYDYCHIARYPHVDTDVKRQAHALAVSYFLRATEHDDLTEHVTIECAAGPLKAVLRRPARPGPVPLLICVGGLDVWKEEGICVVGQPYVAAGFAVLAIDGPGTGESPFPMSTEADAMWDPVFDWADARPGFSAYRAVLGTSLGGYWATRVAHTHPARLTAAINHGGPAHYTFSPDWFDLWVERGEYPAGFASAFLSITRSAGASELTARFAELSLLDSGLLEQESAPLLLVNGRYDRTIDPRDMQLLLTHGSPKAARFFEAGHMGFTPQTVPTMIQWLGYCLNSAFS